MTQDNTPNPAGSQERLQAARAPEAGSLASSPTPATQGPPLPPTLENAAGATRSLYWASFPCRPVHWPVLLLLIAIIINSYYY